MILHPETTDSSHALKLKANFDNNTKPATLERLQDLENWLTRLSVESGTFTVAGSDVTMHHTGTDGKEKYP